MSTTPIFKSGKFSRVFVTPYTDSLGTTAGTEVELTGYTGFMIDPGQASIIQFQNASSQGGTIVDDGMKTAPTATVDSDVDFRNDPYSAAYKLQGGTRVAKIRFFEYDPAHGSTPAGPVHVFNNAHITGSPRSTALATKTSLRNNIVCSTPDYSFNAGTFA